MIDRFLCLQIVLMSTGPISICITVILSAIEYVEGAEGENGCVVPFHH